MTREARNFCGVGGLGSLLPSSPWPPIPEGEDISPVQVKEVFKASPFLVGEDCVSIMNGTDEGKSGQNSPTPSPTPPTRCCCCCWSLCTGCLWCLALRLFLVQVSQGVFPVPVVETVLTWTSANGSSESGVESTWGTPIAAALKTLQLHC